MAHKKSLILAGAAQRPGVATVRVYLDEDQPENQFMTARLINQRETRKTHDLDGALVVEYPLIRVLSSAGWECL